MFKVITMHRNSADIVHWLQENVGQLLHYQPIIFWHGQGWHMRDYRSVDTANPNNNKTGWCIEIEDDTLRDKMLLFTIRFG